MKARLMNTDSSAQEPQVIATALVQIEAALNELPTGRKHAYLEAVRRVPWLIPIESPPLRFLRFACFRIQEAAGCLAFYWESRLKIFGEERAFLPLTLVGGALDENDIAFLKSGHFGFLPDDKEGRTVLYTDLLRPCDASPEVCLRVAFYVWSVISENERSQEDGHVAVVGLLGPKLDLLYKQCEGMVSVALPVHVKDTYLLCCCPEVTDSADFFMSMPSALEAMVILTKEREIIYLTNTKDQLAEKMEASGFSKSALPTTVGGILSTQKLDEWLRQRRITEMKRYEHKKAPVMKADPVVTEGGPSTTGPPSTTGAGAANVLKGKNTPLKQASFDKDTLNSQVCENASSALSLAVSTAAAHPDKKHSPENSFGVENVSPDALLRQDLEEALSRIPREEKQAYFEALDRAPSLVRNDPDPVAFLGCEKNDADAAARRLVRFWNLRRDLFGDRAFLPMDQTGSGALSPEDLELFNTGFLQMVPPDSAGRAVICNLPNAFPPDKLKGGSKFRCLFYIGCVAAESETTRRYGYVVLRVMDVDTMYMWQNDREVQRLVEGTFPIRPACAHSLIIHDAKDKKLIYETIVPAFLKKGEVAKYSRFLHTGVSGREIADKLSAHGISKGSIPSSVGGTWTKDDFRVWQKERVALETQRAATVFTADALRLPHFYGTVSAETQPVKQSSSEDRSTSLNTHAPAISVPQRHSGKHSPEIFIGKDSNVYSEDHTSQDDKLRKDQEEGLERIHREETRSPSG